MDPIETSNIDPGLTAEETSLTEAAAKIDNSDFAAFLVESLESYDSQWEIQLLRFLDYFGRPLKQVQFPWLKMFKDSPWPKLIDMIDVPLSQIPKPLYKTSVDWINQVPIYKLAAFVLWAFDDLVTREDEHTCSSKPQVAILVTLAMVLRTKPNALTQVLSTLREMPWYQGQDKLPLTVWMMAQASRGGLSISLYSWAHNLLPLVGDINCNPQSTDLILQLVEKILSGPKARTILVNGAFKEGGQLIPPSSFEILLRLTFPASSARVKATSRFEAIYPVLKEVALAAPPGSKAMKQVTQETFTFSLKLAGEGNPVLAKEATEIAISSLTQNFDCCKLWDDLYEKNLEASVALLKKLVDKWKDHALKLSSSPSDTLTLNRTLKSFRLKNKKAITQGGANASLYIEADKSCKAISWRLSRVRRHLKGTAITAVVVAVAGAAAAVVLSSNPEATTELKNLMDSLGLRLYFNAIPAALMN